MSGVRGHAVVKGEDGWYCRCGHYLHANRDVARDIMHAHRIDLRALADSCEVCAEPAKYRNPPLCAKHYQRYRANSDYERLGRQVCVVRECGELVKAYGYCTKHWRRVQKYGSPEPEGKWSHEHPDRCVVPGCGSRHRSMGLCLQHYDRERKNGHPIWRTVDKQKVHDDRPWREQTVVDTQRLLRGRRS